MYNIFKIKFNLKNIVMKNIVMLLFTAFYFNLIEIPITNTEIEINKKIENMLQEMYKE